MATTKIRTSFSRAVVLGAATFALVLGLFAAPASATVGALTAKLTVSSKKPGANPPPPPLKVGYWWVHVEGSLRTDTRLEAETLDFNGHRIVMRLWGDDSFSDDLLHGPRTFRLSVNPCCAQTWGTFTWTQVFKASLLDEDSLPYDGDELYVGVRLVDSRGRTIRSVETNRPRNFDSIPPRPVPHSLRPFSLGTRPALSSASGAQLLWPSGG